MLIHIRRGTTYMHVKLPFHLDLRDAIRRFCLDHAVEWDYDPMKRVNIQVGKFYHYNQRLGELRLPIGYLKDFKEALADFSIDIYEDEIPFVVPRPIDVSGNEDFQPRDYQIPLIDFLTNPEPGMSALPLQTGKGKTFVAIQTMVKLKLATLIVVSGLVDQWADKITQYTDLNRDEIYIIKEYTSIRRLMELGSPHPVYVASLETLRVWINHEGKYANLPTFTDFLHEAGIGLKIMDEVHEKYNAQIIVDLWSEVKNNVYLSATFDRNNRNGRRIFKTVYPEYIMCQTQDYDQYVHLHMYSYTGSVIPKQVMRLRGYMHAKYESNILKRITKFNHYTDFVLPRVIDMHYINIRRPGDKLVMYFSTKAMVHEVQKVLSEKYPNLNIVTYIEDDPDSVYENPDNDVLITTPHKCGTGTDIPKLRTVINTISFSARTKVIQMLGRLRKLDVDVHYVDIYDRGIPTCVRHAYNRINILRPKALSFSHLPLE